MKVVTLLKSLIAGKAITERVVLLGLFKGIRMELDLRNQMQIYLGLWERETYAFVKRATKEARWSVDVGSARGEFTLFFLKCARMRKVIAVEPWKVVSDIMRRNLALNQLGDDPRLVGLQSYLSTSPEAGHITLDAIELEHDQPGFIKIDVDGGELDVLKSGRNLLANSRVSLLVETHSPELENNCIQLLNEWGYQCKIIKNAWWRCFVPEVRPGGHNRWFSAIKLDATKV